MGEPTVQGRTITEPSVYQDTRQIVSFGGRIERETTFWCVSYTATRPGYIGVDYCPTFTDEASAQAHAEKLKRDFPVARPVGGSMEQ